MKVRQGFVSNSSSSSFICLVSGAVESGMDLDTQDAGMHSCMDEHVFCTRFLITDLTAANIKAELYRDLQSVRDWTAPDDASDALRERYAQWSKEAEIKNAARKAYLDQYPDDGSVDALVEWLQDEDYYEGEATVPCCMCPICNLQHIQNHDLLNWMLAQYDITREQLQLQLQKKFSSQDELQAEIKQQGDKSAERQKEQTV